MRIAVTGAGGRLGGQVVRLLAAQAGHEVVALCRRKITFEPGPTPVEVAYADYADRASLSEALRGANTLVLISSDGEGTAVLRHHLNLIEAAAAERGISHVVALSSVDADSKSPFCYAITNGYTEEALLASGCPVSIARASIFTEFFVGFLKQAVDTGQLRLPASNGRIGLVSRSDVGRCLAALATSEPTGRHHDLTGPAPLDLATIAALTADTWKSPMRYIDISPREHLAEMAMAGEDTWWLYAYSTMFASVREGRWDAVSGEVLRLTGQQPMTVQDVLHGHAPHVT